jgi:TfdA family taurine catabolism dioxygenase TauD
LRPPVRCIRRRQPELRLAFLETLSRVLVAFKSRAPVEDQARHCTYGDGTPIPDRDMERVRDAIWRHMRFFRWRAGDVLLIDNYVAAHGRMPYHGPRQVLVCWA